MNRALRLAQVAPRGVRQFHVSRPANGAISTIGTLGVIGIMGSSAKYDLVQNALPKAEHQVLAWIGGMFVFGNMARMGGSKEEAPAGEDGFDFDKFMKDMEAEESK